MASYQEQIASLRSERAALQDAAQKLAATLAERGSELQALAKRNGELRCANCWRRLHATSVW